MHSKVLIGCATCMYIDAIKPLSLLSLTLQSHSVDIVLSIEHNLESSKALQFLQTKCSLKCSTVRLVQDRIKKLGRESDYQ